MAHRQVHCHNAEVELRHGDQQGEENEVGAVGVQVSMTTQP